ncbi:hypothetical protein CFP56_022931 [Quercus suber]|uniref:Uncharacterized protein n=1 Tax=Quercus suber TaxID=58331 RepID=A0AAW0KA02_QUESU
MIHTSSSLFRPLCNKQKVLEPWCNQASSIKHFIEYATYSENSNNPNDSNNNTPTMIIHWLRSFNTASLDIPNKIRGFSSSQS